jgi:hypothetical protein
VLNRIFSSARLLVRCLTANPAPVWGRRPAGGTRLLSGVTCVSNSDCWAVGYYYDPINNNGFDHTAIESWDGTSWTIVSSPNTSTTQNNVLDAVTCASSSECWAVGYYDSGRGIMQTLIEQWDGTSWTIVPSANTLALESNFLRGIICATTSMCWAVGYSADPTGPILTRTLSNTVS